MSVRGLLVAIVVLGVLAGGVYWSERSKSAEEAKESSGGASKLVSIKDEDVRKVELRRRAGASPVVVERDKANEWRMSSPEPWRVDQSAAGGVATTYTGLSYDRVIEEKAADLSGYGLQTPAVELTVTAKDGKSRKLLIGDETPTGTASYAKFADDPRVFTIENSTKSQLDKTAQDLRDKRLLIFEADKLARVELTAKAQMIEFGRNAQKDWQIVKPKPQRADNGQVEELVRKLGEARMDTSLPAEEAAKIPASFASSPRVATAAVTDSAGTQTIEVRKRGEDYYARSSALQGTFKIPADVGAGLNKGIDDFQNKKIFDFGFNDPTAVDLRDGAKTYSLRKSGETWSSNGKSMDATSVQSLIDKLRDLKATQVRDTGFTSSVIDITVTSDSGKRVEKVAISKAGDKFFAKREGEPSVYELESKAVEEIQRAAADVKEPPPPAKK